MLDPRGVPAGPPGVDDRPRRRGAGARHGRSRSRSSTSRRPSSGVDGRGIDIVFTGLRHGEKLGEVLFSDAEEPAPTGTPAGLERRRRAAGPGARQRRGDPGPRHRGQLDAGPRRHGGGAAAAGAGQRGRRVSRILLSQADVTETEEKAVLEALRSGWVTPLGPEVDAFEAEMADPGRRRARARPEQSGTAALHLALLEVGAGPGPRGRRPDVDVRGDRQRRRPHRRRHRSSSTRSRTTATSTPPCCWSSSTRCGPRARTSPR